MEKTDDILKYLGKHKRPEQFLCGFSMETQNMIGNSRAKLQKKHLDMVAAATTLKWQAPDSRETQMC